MTKHHSHACPGPAETRDPADRPFSPLGWAVWQRLLVAAGSSLLLWAVVWWALD
jgi:hypothetical protein